MCDRIPSSKPIAIDLVRHMRQFHLKCGDHGTPLTLAEPINLSLLQLLFRHFDYHSSLLEGPHASSFGRILKPIHSPPFLSAVCCLHPVFPGVIWVRTMNWSFHEANAISHIAYPRSSNWQMGDFVKPWHGVLLEARPKMAPGPPLAVEHSHQILPALRTGRSLFK